MESDQNDFNPPAIERVALRLLCRTAVMMRGHAEGMFQQGDDYAQELYSGLAAWAEEDIVDELCESEKTAIFTPLGEMDQQAFLDASWACENVVCLAWALNRMPLPRYDELLVLDDLAGPIGLQMTLEEALTGSELRSSEEIEAAAMTYETVYWRVRDKNLEENSSSHSYQKKLMRRAASLGSIPDLVKGDLRIRGKACIDTDTETLHEVISISQERLTALNWLAGQEPNWDDITADTSVTWLWDSDEWREKERSWFDKLFQRP